VTPADRERIEAIRSYALVWKGRDNYADDLQFLLDLLDAASIVAPAETLEKESLRARSEDRIGAAIYACNQKHGYAAGVRAEVMCKACVLDLLASQAVTPEEHEHDDQSRVHCVPGVGHGDLPQRSEGVVSATAPERTGAVRGKLIGIDALLINALAVCTDEAALRLSGARELAADALALLPPALDACVGYNDPCPQCREQ